MNSAGRRALWQQTRCDTALQVKGIVKAGQRDQEEEEEEAEEQQQ